MTTLLAPGATRALPGRLQRFGSADDMRKEASLLAPDASHNLATPSGTPLPLRPSVTHPLGLVPTLKSMLIDIVLEGIVSKQYKALHVGQDELAELFGRLHAMKQLNDDNIALFAALTELHVNNSSISDTGIQRLLECGESSMVRLAGRPHAGVLLPRCRARPRHTKSGQGPAVDILPS